VHDLACGCCAGCRFGGGREARARLREGVADADVLPGGRYDSEPDPTELRDLIVTAARKAESPGGFVAPAASVPPEFWDLDQVSRARGPRRCCRGFLDALPLSTDPVRGDGGLQRC